MDKKLNLTAGGQPSYEELYQRNLYFNKVLENSGDAFLIVSPEGLIVEINKIYCDFLGVKRDQILGRPVLELIPNSRLPEIIQSGETHIDDIHEYAQGQTVSGDRFTTVCRVPIRDKNEIIASMGIIRVPKRTMELAQTIQNLGEELAFYRNELQRHGISKYYFANMHSTSSAFNTAKKLAERFAHNDLPILLLGETGVGKEVFATAIHHASERRRGPFIQVNCAAIPAQLFESELFGYADGAFTGSRKGGKKGKFELANGGTLFLDEIGDMPFSLQVKLLRVLQEKEVEKIGSEKVVPVDVRIIAATNQNLKQEINEKTFRSDLFYRLNVLSVEIPPLRDRMGDLRELVENTLRELNEQYRRNITFSEDTLDIMRGYSWPGNIRELKNEIGRAFMLTEDNVIKPRNLSFSIDVTTLYSSEKIQNAEPVHKNTSESASAETSELFQKTSTAAVSTLWEPDGREDGIRKCPESPNLLDFQKTVPMDENTTFPLSSTLETPPDTFPTLRSDHAAKERQLILDALTLCRYNCTKAATRLGIHRTTLYTKMATLGIDILELRNPV